MTQPLPWRIRVLTLFPQMFPGPWGVSLVGKALAQGLWNLETTDIRGFAHDPHQTVDDTPYGGGAGMVMKSDVIGEVIDHVLDQDSSTTLVYLSPRGQLFNQAMAQQMIQWPSVTFLCGRYEGVDERVFQAYPWHQISLGDFILTGGEMALFPLVDACVRLLPGVIGKKASLEDESFSQGLLEYPHYTRPAVWHGHAVPPVLLSGHHEQIQVWRHQQALELTQTQRPDLWKHYLEKLAKK